MQAVTRAVSIFSIKPHYKQLRKNAEESVLDTKVVAEAWANEFARLRRVIWSRENPATSILALEEDVD